MWGVNPLLCKQQKGYSTLALVVIGECTFYCIDTENFGFYASLTGFIAGSLLPMYSI